MKKASLVILTAVLALCLAGCGSSNESAQKEDVVQNDPAPLSVKAVESTKVEACDDYLYGNAHVGMKEYVDRLLANAPENEFTVAVAEEHDKITAGGISGIEEDLLDVFVLLPKVYHLDSGIEVGKAWYAGYDGLEAESENRLIVMELSGTPKKDKDSNPYWVFKTFRWPEASQNAG